MKVKDFLGILDFSQFCFIDINGTTFCTDFRKNDIIYESMTKIYGDRKINHIDMYEDIYDHKGVVIGVENEEQ